MSFSTFAAFWAVSFLFVITPGADWAYAIAAGLRGRVVLPAVAGLLSGHLLATAVIAAGVGGLVTRFPMVMLVMTIVGACYLIWLGINVFRHPSAPRAGADDLGSGLRWAIKGTCISGLNPKVFLLFLALLPQFTEPDSAWPISIQMLLLGLVHTFSCALVYLLVGFGSEVILQARPRAALLVSHFSGAAMIVVGLLLLIEQALR
ncbi:LysE family translocator [Pseudomonas syringae]|uniref:Amino acid transporter LysE n=1 Tax=Pseudomonas syringae pv. aceris TaxID=199198 RepID=A0A0P9JI97_PSESX|nr:LysE family translocator [Pseudomonas syringae]EGH71418.1 amino acid transporter LysE [Pseudomonas syringae pv. aceris str. M302273]KPW15867.1 Amino acid transporter LysE [Pseudomonas syringae pv. aceris]